MSAAPQATLMFLITEDRVLLAMKKRGFGKGHWNGVGGKPEPNEAIEQAAVRECQEEIGVTPLSFKQVAIIDFEFPPVKQDWNQRVTVYMCDKWEGEPAETEEMAPQWFDKDNLPYDAMWPDDRYWLPEVLVGKNIEATFVFDDQENISQYEIKPVPVYTGLN